MKSARAAAFDILLKIHKEKAYSNLALDALLGGEDSFPPVEKAFISALVYGVTERTLTLDYQLERYLSQPLKKLKPQVLVILRMGAYQLLFMDKIPVSAAVNESVKLTKSSGCAFVSGLVNAVLRKVAANGLVLPEGNAIKRCSVEFSVPEWILKLWSDCYGKENALKIAESSVGAAETVLRVNTLKITREALIERLKSEGVEAEEGTVDNSVVIRKAGSLRELPSYGEGLFHVQDTASQLCCMALGAKEGERVLDICSAPGGKAFTTAEYMNNRGEIVACDIYGGRLKLISSGAERLDISIIKTVENDASVFNESFGMFDKIICDVPCSGLGVIRRKPEIRLKKQEDIDNLPEIQYSIMKTASRYLKRGGVMIYSTCSLNRSENEDIFNRFLYDNPEFEAVKVLPDITRFGDDTYTLTLLPHIHMSDGFFISAIRRRNDD